MRPWMFLAVALVVSNGLILLVATPHIRRSTGTTGRAISSVALLLLTVVAVLIAGEHACDEGHTPPFVVFGTAVLAAGLPWVLRSRPWVLQGAIAVVVTCGITVATLLTQSYHRRDITGNPEYASGRFWHSTFTGQYPREAGQTGRAGRNRANGPPVAVGPVKPAAVKAADQKAAKVAEPVAAGAGGQSADGISCFGLPGDFSGKLTAAQEESVPEALRGAFYVESVQDLEPAELHGHLKYTRLVADETVNGVRHVALRDYRCVDFGNGVSGMMIVIERYRVKDK